jgi:glycosyltransferase involved in cell wall biosynthesis
MRVAWFAPFADEEAPLDAPDFACDVLPLLTEHEIEVFAASGAVAPASRHTRVRDAYDVVWRHLQRPFDLFVYHLSNRPEHEYVWGYLFNYPGLLVLHEGHLHHSRARVLLDRLEPKLREYGDELAYNHQIDAALGQPLASFTGPALRAWPMRRAAIASARTVAVHDDALAEVIAEENPAAAVAVIRPGIADPGTHATLRSTQEAAALRERVGVPADGVLLGLLGIAGRAGRIPEVLQAMSSLRTTNPHLYLLVAGREAGDCNIREEVRRRGLTDRVSVVEMAKRKLPSFLGACDIALSLAWPPDANTAVNWLRPLACGLPTIVTEGTENARLPLLDPRTWTVGAIGDTPSADAIGVSVDLSSERESLKLAIARLSADFNLRRRIGQAGRAWWSERHTLGHMAADYVATMARTLRHRPLPAALPKHLRPDVFEHARDLAQAAGISLPPELASRHKGTE